MSRLLAEVPLSYADLVPDGATEKEEELFASEGMQPRKRCAPCLQIKKDKQPYPIELECVGCKGTFIFSVGSQKHFKAQNWSDPKRCVACRPKRAAAVAEAVTEAPPNTEVSSTV